MAARVKNIFGGQIRNRKCPKAVGVYHPSDAVSLRPWFVSRIGFKFFSDSGLIYLSCVVFSIMTASTVPHVIAQRGGVQLQGL
jgi:hypothetical protein